MNNVDWNWIVGWIGATIFGIVFVCVIGYNVFESNQRYYDSMNKCITSGGSFVPTINNNANCLMGNK